MDCVFCNIIAGVIPAERLYEDGEMILIRDADPKARLHYLAIPKRHYAQFGETTEQDRAVLGRMLRKIAELAPELGLVGGYRLTINQGEDAGQTVRHLHVHVMGGQPLGFPDLRQA